MKLKWKLFFLCSHQTTTTKKIGWKNNKLLTILQEQFASHWHKKKGRRREQKYGKLLFLIIAFLQIEFELNISSWSQWNDDLIFSPLKFSFFSSSRNFFWQNWKRKRNSEIRFDFSYIVVFLKNHLIFTKPCTHSRRKKRHSRDGTFSISLFSNFLFLSFVPEESKNELGTAARTRDEEKIKFKDFHNPFFPVG